ncbi:MAG: plasmid maintenance system antidote protein [Bacteroidales bacterium]|nr:plasmid maintenance system antidote protein [Bacteroidales bacterium]
MKDQLSILKGIHPGFFLEHELKKRNLKKGTFSLSIQEYPQTIGAVTKGRRKMNTALALKIEHELELEEGSLMVLQVYYDIEQQKKQQKTMHPALSKLRPALFWDTDIRSIDWDRQKRAVIQRVFERGNETEKYEITRFYGLETIKTILETPNA